jgi:hypothetical protein
LIKIPFTLSLSKGVASNPRDRVLFVKNREKNFVPWVLDCRRRGNDGGGKEFKGFRRSWPFFAGPAGTPPDLP